MKSAKTIRCAIYTRVSTDQGLEQEFNSLDAQREASEAYIKSQAHEGWICLKDQYDDGGYSGGSMERPALQRLLEDVRHRKTSEPDPGVGEAPRTRARLMPGQFGQSLLAAIHESRLDTRLARVSDHQRVKEGSIVRSRRRLLGE